MDRLSVSTTTAADRTTSSRALDIASAVVMFSVGTSSLGRSVGQQRVEPFPEDYKHPEKVTKVRLFICGLTHNGRHRTQIEVYRDLRKRLFYKGG